MAVLCAILLSNCIDLVMHKGKTDSILIHIDKMIVTKKAVEFRVVVKNNTQSSIVYQLDYFLSDLYKIIFICNDRSFRIREQSFTGQIVDMRPLPSIALIRGQISNVRVVICYAPEYISIDRKGENTFDECVVNKVAYAASYDRSLGTKSGRRITCKVNCAGVCDVYWNTPQMPTLIKR
jgi:hypothetical protein